MTDAGIWYNTLIDPHPLSRNDLSMSAPIKTLPVVQNWDCQATGSCCKEYRVNISPEEKQRLDEQGWSP